MGFCVLQSFGYSFIARGFNTGRINLFSYFLLHFPGAPASQFYQGKSLGHSPSRIPRTGNNQRSVKEKGGFLHLCQKIHLFPLQTKLTPGMRCDEIFYRPPAGMPAILPLRYETAHNSFQMGRAVIPCRGQNSSN